MDDIVPKEFVAEENLNYDKEALVNEGVMEDDETIRTSNLPPPPTRAHPRPSAAVPSPLIPCLTKRRVKTPSLLPLMIKPS